MRQTSLKQPKEFLPTVEGLKSKIKMSLYAMLWSEAIETPPKGKTHCVIGSELTQGSESLVRCGRLLSQFQVIQLQLAKTAFYVSDEQTMSGEAKTDGPWYHEKGQRVRSVKRWKFSENGTLRTKRTNLQIIIFTAVKTDDLLWPCSGKKSDRNFLRVYTYSKSL